MVNKTWPSNNNLFLRNDNLHLSKILQTLNTEYIRLGEATVLISCLQTFMTFTTFQMKWLFQGFSYKTLW